MGLTRTWTLQLNVNLHWSGCRAHLVIRSENFSRSRRRAVAGTAASSARPRVTSNCVCPSSIRLAFPVGAVVGGGAGGRAAVGYLAIVKEACVKIRLLHIAPVVNLIRLYDRKL